MALLDCTPNGLSQPRWCTILSPTDLGTFPQHLNGSQHLNPQRALQTPSQGNVDDAEGHQVWIRSQGCSEQGKIWDPAYRAQQSWAAQLSPMWCHRDGELDDLSLGRHQVHHKLISSWINMVTTKDMNILISASTTEILVLMAMLTNVHSTLQICNMPFLARVTCSLVHIQTLQFRGTVVCNLMHPLSHASSPVVQLVAFFSKGSN